MGDKRSVTQRHRADALDIAVAPLRLARGHSRTRVVVRSTAHPIAQVQRPVALNHHVRVIQQVLCMDRAEVALA
jgi:hypothetical protein